MVQQRTQLEMGLGLGIGLPGTNVAASAVKISYISANS